VATLRGACQLHVLQGRPQAALQLLYQALPVVAAGTAEGVPQLILTTLAGVLRSEVSLTAISIVRCDLHVAAASLACTQLPEELQGSVHNQTSCSWHQGCAAGHRCQALGHQPVV
jgi:hypothetical protein